jgi:selenocysteine lyase/cysteine desulfurase
VPALTRTHTHTHTIPLPSAGQVVFTRSATDALKTVGETFPWAAGGRFAYLGVNHNSVLGVREYAMAGGARWETRPFELLRGFANSV